jgi:iron complex outermembrane recepter protein
MTQIRSGVTKSEQRTRYKTISNGGIVTVNAGDTIGTVPQVPSPWNITGSLEYSLNPIDDWRVTMRLEDIFHSKNTGPYASYDPASISYAPDIPPNPSTNVLNLRLSAEYQKIEVEAFVNNLLNSTPLLNRGQDTIASNLFYLTTLRPLTFGLGAYWHF